MAAEQNQNQVNNIPATNGETQAVEQQAPTKNHRNQNMWFGTGRVAGPPTLQYIEVKGKQKAKATFAIYCGRGNGTSDILDIVAWGNTAEFVAKYVKTAMGVSITARLQANSYQNKDGVWCKRMELVADDVEITVGQARKEESAPAEGQSSPQPVTQGQVQPQASVPPLPTVINDQPVSQQVQPQATQPMPQGAMQPLPTVINESSVQSVPQQGAQSVTQQPQGQGAPQANQPVTQGVQPQPVSQGQPVPQGVQPQPVPQGQAVPQGVQLQSVSYQGQPVANLQAQAPIVQADESFPFAD